MYEEASTSHLILLVDIGDGHLILSDEPYIAINASMIGEVECHLFLAWRVVLVVAIVGFNGDDDVIAYGTTSKGDGDGQVAALMFFHLLAIDVDGLLTHDGFEVQCHITSLTLLGHREVFTIPRNALIVTAATGLSRHQLYAMGC